MVLNMSRRVFLGGVTGSMAAYSAPVVARSAVRAKRVLVLGAGMSGLTAALALLRRGHQVTVIEYQDRVGGRVLSLPLKNGQFSEAGAGHFRSNMPYFVSYVRHFNLPILSLNDGLPRYLIDGKTGNAADLGNWPWPVNREERGVSVASSLNRYLFRAGLDTDTVLDADWPHPEMLARLDNIRLDNLLKSFGASEAFCKILGAHASPFVGGAQALSVMPRFAYHFGEPGLFRIAGGNEQLPIAIAKAVGKERIILNAPVRSIDQSGRDVTVTVSDGREFKGDAIISTIPFSVLPEITVRPHWSVNKLKMINEVEWDKIVKIIIQNRTPSWLAKNVHGWPMIGSDRPWERVIDIAGNEQGGYGNAFFYLNNKNADAILNVPAEDRAQVIIEQFHGDMPGFFDDIIGKQTFVWKDQPWIKGAYGSLPLGGGWMIKEWSKPEGRIYFAGDYTTLKTGWVEGAIESGLRAARQIDPLVIPEGAPKIRHELSRRRALEKSRI